MTGIDSVLFGPGDGVPIRLMVPFGSGRAATIHELLGEKYLAVKLYLPTATPPPLVYHLNRAAREWLDESGNPRLTWPIDTVRERGGPDIGFLMLRLPDDEWQIADNCLSSVDRAATAAKNRTVGWLFDWAGLVGVAAELARLVADVHRAGFIVADLSSSNVLVSQTGNVALVDCDGMVAIRDLRPGGARPLTTARYRAPELRKPKVDVSVASDAWSLGVLICELLLNGSHPFDGPARKGDQAGTALHEDNVASAKTRFRRTKGRSFRKPAVDSALVPLSALPASILELCLRCFDDGRDRPGLRPMPDEWRATLAAVRFTRCNASAGHAYAAELAACPWCQVHPDPFPYTPMPADALARSAR